MVELMQLVLLLNVYSICVLYSPFGSDYILPSPFVMYI